MLALCLLVSVSHTHTAPYLQEPTKADEPLAESR